ncbi:hypothetical protein D3C73_1168020 [compost metagenome]
MLHGCGFADQRLHPRLLRFALLIERQRALHSLSGQGLVQHQFQFGQRHWFGDVVERALLHRHHGIFDVAVAGHHDHFEVGRTHAQLLNQIVAAHARQRVVGEHHVRGKRVHFFQRLFSRVADRYLEFLALEVRLNILREEFVILDQ